MKIVHALRHRRFALLFSGQTISRVGDHFYQIALAWWVLEKTGSATAMGMVMVFTFTPMLVFLLIGGVTVDRISRITVMLASDLLRGALVIGMAIMALLHVLEIWQVYVASLLFGLVDAFFQPAYSAAVPQIVPEEDLPSANALGSLSQQLGRVTGPALGAILVARAGAGWGFALDGISFLASACCLVPLIRDQPAVLEASTAKSEHAIKQFYHDLREGLSFVFSSTWLWMTIVMFTIVNVLLAGPYGVSLPFLVERNLGGGVKTLGLLYAMFPIGYAIAALLMGQLPIQRRRGWIMYAGATIACIMIALMGLRISIPLLCLAAIVNGFALEACGLCWMHVMQQRVPPQMLGRVSSIDAVGSYALMPIGYALAGWATDHFGAPAVFVLCGSLAALLSAAGLLNPAIRNMD